MGDRASARAACAFADVSEENDQILPYTYYMNGSTGNFNDL